MGEFEKMPFEGLQDTVEVLEKKYLKLKLKLLIALK